MKMEGASCERTGGEVVGAEPRGLARANLMTAVCLGRARVISDALVVRSASAGIQCSRMVLGMRAGGSRTESSNSSMVGSFG